MINIFKKERYVFIYGKDFSEKIRKQIIKDIVFSFVSVFLCFAIFFTGFGLAKVLGLFAVAELLIWVMPELKIKQRCDELALSYKMSIPDFLDVTALLLEAGQPIWYAVETASEMADSELCQKINSVFHDGSGTPETQLEKLASELKTPEVSSAVAAIIQNSRKGERELSAVLRTQSSICRRIRKDAAEELANKASNLMLIPTVMVFGAIIAMLIAPAIMQLNFI